MQQAGAILLVLLMVSGTGLHAQARAEARTSICIDPSGLMQAAGTANARVYTIDPRGWSSAVDRPGISQADWDGYLEATRSVLREVAARTQGMTVFTDADLNGAQSRLTAGRR